MNAFTRGRAAALALLTTIAWTPTPAGAGGVGTLTTDYQWNESQAGRPLDLTGYVPTFVDEFDTMSVTGNLGKGPWYAPVHANFGKVKFVAPGTGNDAYSIANGILTLRARKQADGTYTSGMMESIDSLDRGFIQAKGYFEIRARLPVGAGAWPGFWLHSMGGDFDRTITMNEIDVIEWYGADPKGLHQSLHIWPAKYPRPGEPTTHSWTSNYSGRSDAQLGFHTYGVEITDDWVILYYDRKELTRYPALPIFKLPVYMLVSMSLTDTAGAPDVMDFQVDYVRAWMKPPGTPVANLTILANGTFEVGALSYWGINANAISVTDTTPRGSSKVAQVNANGGINQNVTARLQPGVTYKLTGVLKSGSATDPGLFGVDIKVNGVWAALNRVRVTSTDYKPYEITFTVPAGMTEAYVVLKQGIGTSWIRGDDFTLVNQILP
ncbi:carbohydrate binding domain-containing protein [Prosthecomicrobium sp. N25]|uniref:carbohydrate binding domain-containing protein n=1 Tax=Prosthecomicrobium sp. N25 TaxID=3129254 RepID=UPI003078407D